MIAPPHQTEGEGWEQARAAARKLAEGLTDRAAKIVLAESCTGGLIAALLSEIPGASAFLWGGFVVYTEEAKIEMLGVSRDTLERQGAVSEATAREMVLGALKRSGADLALGVTGFAGPEAPAREKGPGRVVLAWAGRGGMLRVEERRFSGSRAEIRLDAARTLLEGANAALDEAKNRY